MIIRIKDLRLRTIIGVNDWEKSVLQDVVINIEMEYDGREAARTDSLEDAVNYKALTKEIVHVVEKSRFQLLESLVTRVLDLVMEDRRVRSATVAIDKPSALRFADSVSVSATVQRDAQ